MLIPTCAILWEAGSPGEAAVYVSEEPVARLQLQFAATENTDNGRHCNNHQQYDPYHIISVCVMQYYQHYQLCMCVDTAVKATQL